MALIRRHVLTKDDACCGERWWMMGDDGSGFEVRQYKSVISINIAMRDDDAVTRERECLGPKG
jgi:hypothetical protein